MEFEQYEQKLTTEELAAFEQQYNITLPKAFKEHYLQYNGGYPPYENVKGTKHVWIHIYCRNGMCRRQSICFSFRILYRLS